MPKIGPSQPILQYYLSDNTHLHKSDKYVKVRPLYDITNRSFNNLDSGI